MITPLAAGILLLGGSLARAADTGGVAVVPFRVAPAGIEAPQEAVLPIAAAAMEEGIRAATLGSALVLVGSGDLSLRLARAAYAPDAERHRAAARKRIDDGYASYFALDYPGARAALGEALGAMERSPQLPDDLATLSDIKLLEGLVALADGNGADASFDTVVRLTPARTLDPKKFPPYAVQALKAAKQRLEVLPTTQVNVETEPAEASISIDGVPRGTSPVTIDRIATGEHFYRVEKPRMKPLFGRKIFTSDSEPFSLMHLEPVRASELEAPVSSAVAQNPGASLARLLLADRVLLAALTPDGARRYQVTMWWADASGAVSVPETRTVSAERAALTSSLAVMAGEVIARPANGHEPAEPAASLAHDLALLAAGDAGAPFRAPPPPLYRNKFVVGGAVGAVILGLLGGAAYAASQPGRVDVTVTVNPNQ